MILKLKVQKPFSLNIILQKTFQAQSTFNISLFNIFFALDHISVSYLRTSIILMPLTIVKIGLREGIQKLDSFELVF